MVVGQSGRVEQVDQAGYPARDHRPSSDAGARPLEGDSRKVDGKADTVLQRSCPRDNKKDEPDSTWVGSGASGCDQRSRAWRSRAGVLFLQILIFQLFLVMAMLAVMRVDQFAAQ